MVAQLQELLLSPLCGFSMMVTKCVDGSGTDLAYEVHTPKLHDESVSAVVHAGDAPCGARRAPSQALAARMAGGRTEQAGSIRAPACKRDE